jgi:uncharacterized membrane-anchored protein YhcB (DUF1043 family)
MQLILPTEFKSKIGEALLLASNNSTKVKLAAPFFTSAEIIKQLARDETEVYLIVRLCSFTRITALADVLSLPSPLIQVRFTVGDWFHTKLYVFERQAPLPSFALVGSGNLTGGGLRENHELAVRLEGSKEVESLGSCFDDLWQNMLKTRHLTIEVLNEVESDIRDHQSKEFSNNGSLEKKLAAIFEKQMEPHLDQSATGFVPSTSEKIRPRTVLKNGSRRIAEAAIEWMLSNPGRPVHTSDFLDVAGNDANDSHAANATMWLENAGLIHKSASRQHPASSEFADRIRNDLAAASSFAYARLSSSSTKKSWQSS